MKDYYSVLNVKPDASKDEIKTQFKKLAHQYHPDKNTGDEKKFKELAEAKEILLDDTKRRNYDLSRHGGGGFNPGAGFGGFESSHEGFDFSDIFGQAFHAVRNRGADINLQITLTFEESVYGAEKELSIPYRTKKKEKVKIPFQPNVENGTRFVLKEKGEIGKDNAPPGDAYITVYIQPSLWVRKNNNDLFGELELCLTEFLLGCEKQVKNAKGENISITIPKNSKPESTFIINGQGIPKPYGNDRLIIVLKLKQIRKINSKAISLLKELQKEGL